MRKDILLVKHCYDINWAKDLNELLGNVFFDPFKFTEKSYLPGRTQQMRYEAKLIEYMRSNKITKLFFVNYIDDFSNNFIKAGFVKEIYGIVHSSNYQLQDVGNDKRLTSYENGILPMANKIFTNSDYLGTFINRPTINIGLPIQDNFKTPKIENNQIIFNHRLAKEKGVDYLLQIEEKYRDRFVISCPKGNLSMIPKLKKLYKNFYFKIPHNQYRQLLSQCGFQISLASHETFGYGVQEAISNGLCPLVIDNNTTCYSENIIEELRFKNLDELYQKLDHLSNNKKEKERLILKQQDLSSKYKQTNWIKNLLNEL
jgi:glycosyltransferase involved in cell wall biosynthesis